MRELRELFIEKCIYPFIIFDANGNVLDYNEEGEYILSLSKSDELYSLAINNASLTPDFKTTFLDFKVEHLQFCALSVGYIDSDKIGVMLHKNSCAKKMKFNTNLHYANIFTLIDIAINSHYNDLSRIKAEYDTSIPEIKLDVERLLKVLNKIFKQLADEEIYIKVSIPPGKKMKIESKSYPIVAINIHSQNCNNIYLEDENFLINISKEKIHIEFPLIT